MATPEGRNIYDTNGTVLYRVLSRDDHEAKLFTASSTEHDNSEPSAEGHDSILAGGGMSIATKYGPLAASKIRMSGAKKPRKLVSLSAFRSSGKADEKIVAVNQHLTVERALADLFPPAPLEPPPESDGPSTQLPLVRELRSAESSRGPKNPWLKVASVDHTSRLDVVQLHQHLQRRCAECARMRGVLCPIREKIFEDGLSELTRQVTVLCPERGLLLKDLNDGMTQCTETYDILFDSACQYAVRKSIERDLHSYLFDEKKALESEVRRLDNRVNELRAKHDGMLKRFEEQKAVNAKMHEEEINYMKKANQQLISEIKRLVSMENQK